MKRFFFIIAVIGLAIWSTKLIENFYPRTVFGTIANTDYEGEIKSFGDSVTIRTIPAVTTFSYAKGQKITYKAEESAKVELLINKGRGFAFPVNAVDKKQADINFVDAWSKDAGQRIKIAVDTEILAAVYADVATLNKGIVAGQTSGMYNIGTTAASIPITKANVIEYISYCEQVLTEQNCPDDGRWFCMPGWMKNCLDMSDLKDSSMTGRESTLPNGRIGSLLNFDILVSNCYTAVSDTYNCYHVIFGHKSALTFAAQMDFVETLKNPDDYGDLIRGLMIYGYEVVKPTAMGELYCRRG